MKFHCTLDGTKLKKEPIRHKGEITRYDNYWLATVKVSADKVDANALAHLSDELLEVELNAVQGRLV